MAYDCVHRKTHPQQFEVSSGAFSILDRDYAGIATCTDVMVERAELMFYQHDFLQAYNLTKRYTYLTYTALICKD